MSVADELAEARARIAELTTECEIGSRRNRVMETRIAELEAEAQAWHNEYDAEMELRVQAEQRAEQAEAEAARYRAVLPPLIEYAEGLEREAWAEGASSQWNKNWPYDPVVEAARKALAATEREPSSDISQWETNGGTVERKSTDDSDGCMDIY